MKNLFLTLPFLLLLAGSSMATSRFWIGGTGATNQTAHWSSTSGGTTCSCTPATGDDVFFNASSGGGTVTVAAAGLLIHNLDSTGFTGTINTVTNGSGVGIGGTTLTIGSGTSLVVNGTSSGAFDFDVQSTAGTVTVTTNGKNLGNFVATQIDGAGTTSLADDLTCAGLVMGDGTFSTNNHNVTATIWGMEEDGGLTVNMGSGTWTITGNDTQDLLFTNTTVGDVFGSGALTVNASTSTLKFTDSTSNTKTIQLNISPVTFGSIWLSGSGTGAFILNTAMTVSTFTADTPPHTMQFAAGNTYTVTTWTVAGSSGNLMTLNSSSPGSRYTLSDSSGTDTCNFCSITDSAATGGATWNALTGSTNGGNNTGWNFPAPSGPSAQQKASGFFRW